MLRSLAVLLLLSCEATDPPPSYPYCADVCATQHGLPDCRTRSEGYCTCSLWNWNQTRCLPEPTDASSD